MTNNIIKKVKATTELVNLFINDLTEGEYQDVVSFGVEEVKNYTFCEEWSLHKQMNNIENVDWDIAYLIIAEQRGLESISEQLTCKYMGIDSDSDAWVAKASYKVKFFGPLNLSDISRISNVNIRTLQTWFKTKKIIFHMIVTSIQKTAISSKVGNERYYLHLEHAAKVARKIIANHNAKT